MSLYYDNNLYPHKDYQVGGLNFIGCAGNKIKSVDHFITELESSFTGQQEIVNTALKIEDTNAEIVRVSFNNNDGKLNHQLRVGGAIACLLLLLLLLFFYITILLLQGVLV